MDDINHNGRNSKAADTWLAVNQVASLLGVTERAIRKQCAAGKFITDTVKANGGSQYRILLSSLPQAARAKWALQQARQEVEKLGDPREWAERVNAEQRDIARKEAAAGKIPEKVKLEPVPVNDEEAQELWDRYDRAPAGCKREAQERLKILRAYEDLEFQGTPKTEIAQLIRAEFGISGPTLWRLRELVKGQPPTVWLPLLMPNWKGRTAQAEFTEAAWEFIKEDWGRLNNPNIADCYRRAQKLARERGWVIPSRDTVERRINALPHWWRVARRQGLKALERIYPAQQRDYRSLKLHELWCADGRKADVFCRWPDGTIGRPIIVGWLDVRTRVCLGFEIGRTESADLIRLAFKNAADTVKAIPEAVLMDNGRGFASKLLTGGIPNRYRFKVRDEDIPGILPLMGIEVSWATPGHGQAKPIERWWRTLAEADRRPEFQGAYCGNRPDAKPEDFDPKKAVPIETYKAILTEEIDAYHERAHRGDGMDGKSPRDVYTELLAYTPVRQPTAAQLRLCLLAAEAMKPHRDDGSFTVLGNRYWAEKCADLRRDRSYVLRFNPEDALQPIAVYDGEKFICDAPLIEKTGFRDQQAAKNHMRANRQFVKSKKQQAAAQQEMFRAENWLSRDDEIDTETGEIRGSGSGLPTPKVVVPLRPDVDYTKPQQEENDDDMSIEEFNRLLAEGMAQRAANQGD
jgi:putative transposase